MNAEVAEISRDIWRLVSNIVKCSWDVTGIVK